MAQDQIHSPSEFVALSPASIDSLVSSIMATICPSSQNSTRLRLCGDSLASAMAYLVYGARRRPQCRPDDIQSAKLVYPVLLTKYPKFVNAIASFILSVQDEEQLQALEQRLSICNCASPNTLPFSLLHHQRPEGFFEAITYASFTFLISLAKVTSGTLIRSRDRTVKRKSDKALEKITHYMLDQSHYTLNASTIWYQRTKDEIILRFITGCIKMHENSFKAHVVSAGGQGYLALVSSDLHMAVQGLREGAEPSLAFAQAMFIRAEFVFTVVSQFPARSGFLEAHSQQIYDTSLMFFDIYESLDDSARKRLDDCIVPRAFAEIAFKTIVHLPPALDSNGRAVIRSMDEVFKNSYCGLLLGDSSVFMKAWMLLCSCQKMKECIHCGKPPSGSRFLKCAQCGIPTYCSKECQKEAWSLPEFPHKAVCKEWLSLRQVWPLDINTEELPLDENQLNENLKNRLVPLGMPTTRVAEILEHLAFFDSRRREREMHPGPSVQI